MVLQCINGVGSNPVEGRTKYMTALKSNTNTVWFNFRRIKYYKYILVRLWVDNADIVSSPGGLSVYTLSCAINLL